MWFCRGVYIRCLTFQNLADPFLWIRIFSCSFHQGIETTVWRHFKLFLGAGLLGFVYFLPPKVLWAWGSLLIWFVNRSQIVLSLFHVPSHISSGVGNRLIFLSFCTDQSQLKDSGMWSMTACLTSELVKSRSFDISVRMVLMQRRELSAWGTPVAEIIILCEDKYWNVSGEEKLSKLSSK